MILQCLIVDDEPIAQEILETYINNVDFLKCVSKCNNASEALQILHSQPVDVLFLDIKMPGLSGLELIKTLQNPPNIIFTTAYSEFAVQSYELNATDYLLKPISFERFLKAVNKVISSKKPELIKEITQETAKHNDFMFFKSDKKVFKFYYTEILFLEGFGNYVKVHSTNKKTILILDKLSDLEKKLLSSGFIRVHKSFIVNKAHINEISGNRININKNEIPIGASYKINFWNSIKE